MNRPAATVVTAVLAAMTAASVFAADAQLVSINTPATSQSVTYSSLIARSGKAVRDHVLAHAPSGTRLSDFWVFPTADANSVFVRYTLGDSKAEHLLLVEMNGTRIARLRDLSTLH